MRFSSIVAAVAALLPALTAAEHEVFAHYMMGYSSGMTQDMWTTDVNSAKAASIDGFALNCGPTDDWNSEQLGYAFSAAEAAGFSLFISFDMSYTWDPTTVGNWINQYSASSAYFRVNNQPVASTFEGPTWASNWAAVKSAVSGGVFVMPDYTSLGPSGIGSVIGEIDGFFSWDAWPEGNTTKTNDSDEAWIGAIQGKPYMMGASPWFYADVAGKNWNNNGDTLWHDRWESIIDTQPDFVQIITWNDYSESSYITDIVASQVYPPSEPYVTGFSHSAFRAVLPYYINAYKTNSRSTPTSDSAIAWFRTTPNNVCSDGGTQCSQDGSGGAAENCAEDAVFVLASSATGSTVTIQIGSASNSYQVQAGMSVVSMPFGGNTGAVTVSIGSSSVTGPQGTEISNDCPAALGHVNFNAVTIQTT